MGSSASLCRSRLVLRRCRSRSATRLRRPRLCAREICASARELALKPDTLLGVQALRSRRLRRPARLFLRSALRKRARHRRCHVRHLLLQRRALAVPPSRALARLLLKPSHVRAARLALARKRILERRALRRSGRLKRAQTLVQRRLLLRLLRRERLCAGHRRIHLAAAPLQRRLGRRTTHRRCGAQSHRATLKTLGNNLQRSMLVGQHKVLLCFCLELLLMICKDSLEVLDTSISVRKGVRIKI